MKKLISAVLAGALALSLAACGSTASSSAAASSEAASSEAVSSEAAAETNDLAGTTIKVAASPVPHAEILGVAKDILAEQGITCLLYTSPSPRDFVLSRMPSSA